MRFPITQALLVGIVRGIVKVAIFVVRLHDKLDPDNDLQAQVVQQIGKDKR